MFVHAEKRHGPASSASVIHQVLRPVKAQAIGNAPHALLGCKRLEEGTYAVPLGDREAERRREITAQELGALLSGIDLSTPNGGNDTGAKVRKKHCDLLLFLRLCARIRRNGQLAET